MGLYRTFLMSSLAVCAMAGMANIAHAAPTTTVEVVLSDATDDPSHAGMTLMATPATVKAGRVTFHAINQSKALVHEMILVQPPAGGKPLPYDKKEAEVDEHKIKSLGEVSELDPGKSGSLTVTLKPGTYVLICNQASHYAGGMQERFTVTP